MKLPKEYQEKYQKLFNNQEEYQNFIASFSSKPVHAVRVNQLKAGKLPNDLKGAQAVPYVPKAFYGKVPGKTPEHQAGAVYNQEPSAMFVAQVVDAKPGERILDLCAAPGGKSTQIAGMMEQKGLLVANEINHSRAKVLVENLERFGALNPLILNENPNHLENYFPRYFDKILIDAPCSGEGMFRKNPDAIQYWNHDYPKECAARQREIVKSAVKMLKPGGELIYSTCTFAPEEDEQLINWILSHFPFEMVPIKKEKGMVSGKPDWADGNNELEKAVRMFPHQFKGDGHFVAKLKSNEDGKSPKIKTQRSNVGAGVKREWQEFKKNNLTNFTAAPLLEFKQFLYSFNPEIPDLKGLKVMRPGTPLAEIKKNRLEPAYGLAMVLKPEQVKNKIEIDLDQWKKYVRGETFSVSAALKKGWYLLVYKGLSIGFVKVVNGQAKNFFPKGLRFIA